MADKKETQLVAAASKGYNYNYTSLADLVIQNITLPPMRVATLTDGSGTPVIVDGAPVEYIEALIPVNKIGTNPEATKEWVRGARIIVPKGKQTNATQDYGAALTYARRYTALTVLGLACESDKEIEKKGKDKASKEVFDEATAYAELSAMWDQAGGHEGFDDWLDANTPNGFNQKSYEVIKANLNAAIKKKEASHG